MSMNAELNSFETLDGLLESLTKALIDKSVFKWQIPEDFTALYEAMVRLSDNQNNLRVIASLGRTEATLKKAVFDLDKVNLLLPGPPDLALLKDGDDRLYAAQFIKRLSPDWIVLWALNSVWAESGAEKARLVFQEIVIDAASSFETMLVDMGKAGQAYIKRNELAEIKASARFVRVIKVLRASCQSRDINFDIDVGKSIDTFVGVPFSHFTASQKKPNIRKQLVPEVVGLLLDLIGQRFSLAIEYEHYTVLKRIRMWCDDVVWSEISQSNPVIEKLCYTIAEALLILARQNIADGELLKRLKESTKNDQHYSQLCRRIAASGHLDKSISEWLMAGGQFQRSKKTISSEEAVISKGEMADLGDLLLSIHQGKVSIQIANNALGDLELFDPSLVPVIKDLANHWVIVAEITEKITSKRSINLVGMLGRKVGFDRKFFDAADDSNQGQRYGNVVRPAIVMSSASKTKVIKKGIVKPIED